MATVSPTYLIPKAKSTRSKGIPFDLNKLSRLDSLEAKNDFSYFNAETIEAIEETERNLKNSNRKRYSSIQELREALEND